MPKKQPKPIPELSQAEKDRFWNTVDQSGGPDACWPYHTGKQYGHFWIRKDFYISAHRLAFKLFYGHDPFPEILHSCDFPPCCNPAHLSEGTVQMNAIDRCKKGRGHQGDKHWSRVSPEKVKRGDDNISRRRPDLLARGDANGLRLHPDRRPWGDRNGLRLHPEKVSRGELNGMAKLREGQILEIRRLYANGGISYNDIGASLGVSNQTIFNIVHRRTWKHI